MFSKSADHIKVVCESPKTAYHPEISKSTDVSYHPPFTQSTLKSNLDIQKGPDIDKSFYVTNFNSKKNTYQSDLNSPILGTKIQSLKIPLLYPENFPPPLEEQILKENKSNERLHSIFVNDKLVSQRKFYSEKERHSIERSASLGESKVDFEALPYLKRGSQTKRVFKRDDIDSNSSPNKGEELGSKSISILEENKPGPIISFISEESNLCLEATSSKKDSFDTKSLAILKKKDLASEPSSNKEDKFKAIASVILRGTFFESNPEKANVETQFLLSLLEDKVELAAGSVDKKEKAISSVILKPFIKLYNNCIQANEEELLVSTSPLILEGKNSDLATSTANENERPNNLIVSEPHSSLHDKHTPTLRKESSLSSISSIERESSIPPASSKSNEDRLLAETREYIDKQKALQSQRQSQINSNNAPLVVEEKWNLELLPSRNYNLFNLNPSDVIDFFTTPSLVAQKFSENMSLELDTGVETSQNIIDRFKEIESRAKDYYVPDLSELLEYEDGYLFTDDSDSSALRSYLPNHQEQISKERTVPDLRRSSIYQEGATIPSSSLHNQRNVPSLPTSSTLINTSSSNFCSSPKKNKLLPLRFVTFCGKTSRRMRRIIAKAERDNVDLYIEFNTSCNTSARSEVTSVFEEGLSPVTPYHENSTPPIVYENRNFFRPRYKCTSSRSKVSNVKIKKSRSWKAFRPSCHVTYEACLRTTNRKFRESQSR